MRRPAPLGLPALVLALTTVPMLVDAADPFDRHASAQLRAAIEDGEPVASLSMRESSRLKSLGRNVGGPVLVVRTNDGNLAKMVVAWGFRAGSDDAGKETLIPVVVLERLVTYRADRRDVSAATATDVMLFAGFDYNLDIAQVVPAGQGGDLKLTADGNLVPLGDARIVALEKSLLPEPTSDAPDPTDHDGVLPRDFGGTWSIDVDGRWTGELVLTVDGGGRVSGRYTSAESKSSYNVTGRIAAVPHRIKLDFDLDNTRQEVDAYLWTSDKSRMAGTATLAGRPFGFSAKRATGDADAEDD